MFAILSEEKILFGILVFLRLSALLFTMPVFGQLDIPVLIRSLFCVALSISFISSGLPRTVMPSEHEIEIYMWLAVQEISVGIAFGFLSRLLFDGVMMASSLVGYQMGFGTANIMLPGSIDEQTSFSSFHRVLVISLLLVLGFHRHLIYCFSEIFRIIPVGQFFQISKISEFFISISSKSFYVAMQLALPMLAAVMFSTAALGLLSRSVPQLNVFTLSFPFGFFVGISVYVATIFLYPQWLSEHVFRGIEDIVSLAKSAKV